MPRFICRANDLMIQRPLFRHALCSARILTAHGSRLTGFPATPHALCAMPALMCFLSVHPFIGRAVRAHSPLDVFDKPVSNSALFFPGPRAYRTLDTSLSHLFIFIRCRCCVFISPPSLHWHNKRKHSTYCAKYRGGLARLCPIGVFRALLCRLRDSHILNIHRGMLPVCSPLSSRHPSKIASARKIKTDNS